MVVERRFAGNAAETSAATSVASLNYTADPEGDLVCEIRCVLFAIASGPALASVSSIRDVNRVNGRRCGAHSIRFGDEAGCLGNRELSHGTVAGQVEDTSGHWADG